MVQLPALEACPLRVRVSPRVPNKKAIFMDNDNYIIVPITNRFNNNKVIGELKILKSQLPITPNFVFALGYMKDCKSDGYELKEVAIVPDSEYARYLQSVNIVSIDIS